MSFIKSRLFSFEDEFQDGEVMDRSSTELSFEKEGFDDLMDHGFSSPLRGSFPDDSPIKIESKASEQRTPITPPSLCALRLFDSPHTPKSLLERAGTNSPRFTENAKPTVSRLRRNLIKHRGTESEPRNGIRTRYPVCAANVNPFTPDGRGTAISVKRGRSSRWVTLACFL